MCVIHPCHSGGICDESKLWISPGSTLFNFEYKKAKEAMQRENNNRQATFHYIQMDRSVPSMLAERVVHSILIISIASRVASHVRAKFKRKIAILEETKQKKGSGRPGVRFSDQFFPNHHHLPTTPQKPPKNVPCTCALAILAILHGISDPGQSSESPRTPLPILFFAVANKPKRMNICNVNPNPVVRSRSSE
jgi:hypothetical protein